MCQVQVIFSQNLYWMSLIKKKDQSMINVPRFPHETVGFTENGGQWEFKGQN